MENEQTELLQHAPDAIIAVTATPAVRVNLTPTPTQMEAHGTNAPPPTPSDSAVTPSPSSMRRRRLLPRPPASAPVATSNRRTHDEASSANAVAAAVSAAARLARAPPLATNAAGGGAGTAAVCERLDALTQAVHLSLRLQGDIHKAIRQEVAAAMAAPRRGDQDQPPFAAVGGTATAPGSATISAARVDASRTPDDSALGRCVICLDGCIDTVLYRCGHLCLCQSCAAIQQGRCGSCPVCRAPIVDVLKVYLP